MITILVNPYKIGAQISPGDLSRQHAKLEGVSNCTKCHELGEKVSNDKCLSCHTELKQRIDKNLGYHVSFEVKNKDCSKCHSEHHGLNFKMIRFDEKSFKHGITGYELTGAHLKTDCKKCHQKENITDIELRKKEYTYLGLKRDCAACHKDVHQNTLPKDCSKCHTTESFVPASKFNHNQAKFQLVGKHKTVACIECHKVETKNNQKYQYFANVAFDQCGRCHKDPHSQQLGISCKECHIEEAFTIFKGMSRFNHNKTAFILKGKHKQTDCAKCHNLELKPLQIFQDRKGILSSDCVKCHEDIHQNKFGTDCKSCHNEENFHNLGKVDKFDHKLTDFELKGKHIQVECKACHKAKLTDPLPFDRCDKCHKDYHEKQFVSTVTGKIPDCIECHTVSGFSGSSYSIELHNKSRFPLDGAHEATPCFACHKKNEKWSFRNIGEQCIDCHTNIHKESIAIKYYPDKKCNHCHTTQSWNQMRFEHNQTGYILEGMHAKTTCRSCHSTNREEHPIEFVTKSKDCTSCHENKHGSQFEKNGITDCISCHNFENWKANRFDHNTTAFILDGKHKEVACIKCHKEISREGKVFIQYKFENFECVVCHH